MSGGKERVGPSVPGLDGFPESPHNLRVFAGQIVLFVRVVLEVEQADGRLVPGVHLAQGYLRFVALGEPRRLCLGGRKPFLLKPTS